MCDILDPLIVTWQFCSSLHNEPWQCEPALDGPNSSTSVDSFGPEGRGLFRPRRSVNCLRCWLFHSRSARPLPWVLFRDCLASRSLHINVRTDYKGRVLSRVSDLWSLKTGAGFNEGCFLVSRQTTPTAGTRDVLECVRRMVAAWAELIVYTVLTPPWPW